MQEISLCSALPQDTADLETLFVTGRQAGSSASYGPSASIPHFWGGYKPAWQPRITTNGVLDDAGGRASIVGRGGAT